MVICHTKKEEVLCIESKESKAEGEKQEKGIWAK